jgi:cytochrome c
MRLTTLAALVLGLASAGAAMAQAPQGDAARGKMLFTERCMLCHNADAGGDNGAGPALHGVYGRAAAKAPGFSYSDSLKAAGITWTPDKLDTWISDAPKFVPGTLMAAPPVTEAQDRADLIAYLKSQS